MMRTDLKYKISFTMFIVGSLFVFLYIFFDSYLFRQEIQRTTLKSAEHKIYEREDFLRKTLQTSEKSLFAIRNNLLFEKYLHHETDSQKNAEEFFRAIISSNNAVMQLRYIDETGMEKIRFDRVKGDIQKVEELQDKSSRYYFKNNINKDEHIVYSDFDLNIENGKVEVPFNPTYRAILPIQDKNIFRGILIINIFGEELLNTLFNMPSYDGILIDKEGYILYHYQKELSWSKYRKKSFKIDQKYLDAITHKSNKKYDFVIKKFNLPFENELYMILQTSKSIQIEQDNLYQKKMIISILIFIILVSFSTFILYLIFKRLEKQEKEIIFLNEKQHTQEKLLTQQSKMAAMGEMIANIAHQWKQPLTGLSMHIISLEFKLLKDTITKEFLEDFVAKTNKIIQDMGKTIDDFSNFFNPNKVKQQFELQSSIQEALNIVSKHLKDNNITVKFDNSKSYIIYGYRNELIQVFINLINNSKDAIKSKEIKNGEIAIKIEEETEYYKLKFLDNGGGIPENILNRIFEPYFTTKFKEQGTGIGLYMCKMIIDNSFKGEMTFSNQEDGTLCIITLPKQNQLGKAFL